MSHLTEYQKELEKKKYNPIKKKELNHLAINFSGDSHTRDLIVNSNLRLAFQAVKKTIRDGSKDEDGIMELVQVANEAICEAINKYRYDTIDFSYFAYVEAINAVKFNLKNDHTIKPRKVNGELMKADYHFLDMPVNTQEEERTELQQIEPKEDISKALSDIIQQLDVQQYKKDIFLYRYNFGSMELVPYKDIAIKFGYSMQRICQIVSEVKELMKENKHLFEEIYYE